VESNYWTILIIGDHFVTVDLFRGALDRRLTGIQVRYKFVETAWPDDPLKNVEEVHEAGGDVEALVREVRDVDIIVTDYGAVTNTRRSDRQPRLPYLKLRRG